MTGYDSRVDSAYGPYEEEPEDRSRNPHILKWWTPEKDQILAAQIEHWRWVWYLKITDEIVKTTPRGTIESWKKDDPLCARWAWYNVLMRFAKSRADQLGLTTRMRKPEWKVCPSCEKRFIEDSLPTPFIERLGIGRLDFCALCLKEPILSEGNSKASKDDIIKYLQDLANLIERVPPQGFGSGKTDLIDMETEQRLALLKLLKIKPSVGRVKSVFGSWLNALIKAGVLEDGTRKTERGIQCIAKDGHTCLSLGEKTIDDFLYAHRVPHEKEPQYPESGYRGDFKIREVFIEYFGLVGNPEYDGKMKEKIRLCRKYGIKLIAIYPQDLVSQRKLQNKLSEIIHLEDVGISE